MKKQFLFFLILFFLLGLIPVNSTKAQDLSEKLSGRILLQVEGVGQAWYIDPATKQRAFLGRPADAFSIMRELGLGISEKDYESFKISTPKKLSGKILLRVETNGEAYYVNPTDLKMYYLGRPADAFNIMREKGLGISNEDLNTVPVFQKFKEQTEANTSAINSLGQKAGEQPKIITEFEDKIDTSTSANTNSCIADTWNCDAWSECSSGGQQTRMCNLTVNCQNVNTPSPSISQICIYTPVAQPTIPSSTNNVDYTDFKSLFMIKKIQTTENDEILYDAIYDGKLNQEEFWLYFSLINIDLKTQYAKQLASEVRNNDSRCSIALYFKYSTTKLGYSFAYPPNNYFSEGYELASFIVNPFLIN
jgi:hypothetical protein